MGLQLQVQLAELLSVYDDRTPISLLNGDVQAIVLP